MAGTDKNGVKYDSGKPAMDLLPTAPLLEAGDVMRLGAEKYEPRNWERGMDHGRLYGAALRHLLAYWDGEDFDPDTGKSHLAHALCSVLMLRGLILTRPDLDDRPHKVIPTPPGPSFGVLLCGGDR